MNHPYYQLNDVQLAYAIHSALEKPEGMRVHIARMVKELHRRFNGDPLLVNPASYGAPLHIVRAQWFPEQAFMHHSTHTSPEYAASAVQDLIRKDVHTNLGEERERPFSVKVDYQWDRRFAVHTFNDDGRNVMGQTLAEQQESSEA